MDYKKVEAERLVLFCTLYHKKCTVLTTSYWLTDTKASYSTSKCLDAGASPQCFACQNNEYFFIMKEEASATLEI